MVTKIHNRGWQPNLAIEVFEKIEMFGGDRTRCWPWKGSLGGRDHRPVISIFNKTHYAYRVVWMLVNGRELEPGEVVRHKCDNKMCCNPDHLEVGTQKDNIDDTFRRERGHATLKRGQVREALELFEKNFSIAEVQRYFKKQEVEVSRTTLSRIKSGTAFKDIYEAHKAAYRRLRGCEGEDASHPEADGQGMGAGKADSGDH